MCVRVLVSEVIVVEGCLVLGVIMLKKKGMLVLIWCMVMLLIGMLYVVMGFSKVIFRFVCMVVSVFSEVFVLMSVVGFMLVFVSVWFRCWCN